jgi:hypothetical protein
MCTAGKRRSGPISSIFKAKAGRHKEYVERIESLCGRLLDAVDLEQRERAIELLAKVAIANANPTYATYDDTGDNALHCAAKNRDTVLIELLLSAGADPLKKMTIISMLTIFCPVTTNMPVAFWTLQSNKDVSLHLATNSKIPDVTCLFTSTCTYASQLCRLV